MNNAPYIWVMCFLGFVTLATALIIAIGYVKPPLLVQYKAGLVTMRDFPGHTAMVCGSFVLGCVLRWMDITWAWAFDVAFLMLCTPLVQLWIIGNSGSQPGDATPTKETS